MKFKTNYNLDQFPEYKGQSNHEPSMTIPDQSMSIRELMIRHQRGLPLEGEKIPLYMEKDGVLPDIEKLDLSEKMDLLKAARQQVIDLRSRRQKEIEEIEAKRKNEITAMDVLQRILKGEHPMPGKEAETTKEQK